MRVGVLFTGGKDSTYAIHKALESDLEVKYLLTMVSDNPDSWMFHWVNVHLTPYQAEAMRIEHLLKHTSGEKEKEPKDLKRALGGLDIEGVVSGVIASTYQKNRVEGVCRELGLTSIAPLWGREPTQLLREMTDAGFEIVVTSVSALGLDETWLGRKLDESALKELVELSRKYGINVSGEGGEYETLVLDAPLFHKRLELVDAERVWLGDRGHLLVKKARLIR